MIFGKFKLYTTRSGVMQILCKFCHNKHLTRLMAPHAINVTAADRQHKGQKYLTLVAPSDDNTNIGPAVY